MPRGKPHIDTQKILATKGRNRVRTASWKTYAVVNVTNQPAALVSKDRLNVLTYPPFHREEISRETFLWLVANYNVAGQKAIKIDGLQEE